MFARTFIISLMLALSSNALEMLRSGIMDLVKPGAVHTIEIGLVDISKKCTKQYGNIYESGTNPETSSKLLNDAFSRARQLVKKMDIYNHDGTPVELAMFNLSMRRFANYKIWILTASYTQKYKDSGGFILESNITVAVPLDGIEVHLSKCP